MGRATFARDPERGRFRFVGWELDRKTRQLIDPTGAPVALTKGEHALLLAFLEVPQRRPSGPAGLTVVLSDYGVWQ